MPFHIKKKSYGIICNDPKVTRFWRVIYRAVKSTSNLLICWPVDSYCTNTTRTPDQQLDAAISILFSYKQTHINVIYALVSYYYITMTAKICTALFPNYTQNIYNTLG